MIPPAMDAPRLRSIVLRLALAGIALAAASPTAFSARVVRVIDGDSLEVAPDGSREKLEIRLFGIDSPERGQPYSQAARAELSRLVKGKTVRLEVRDHDSYGRTVARVFADGVDVNLAMVREGAAWVYRKYSKDKALLAAEENARRARRGLWGLDGAEPVPPWEWRHAGRRAAVSPEPSTASCGAKQSCREMSSCDEARFYLRECGLTRLDGDRDGVPCEALCRGAP